MIVCTSICANYIPKAAVLAKSVKEHNPSAIFVACIVEREITTEMLPYIKQFDQVVIAKDLGFDQFEKFIFKYDIVEASTAVKGQLFKYLFEEYSNHNSFVYLDPDIKVYDSLGELERLLENHAIILTPHVIEAEDNDDISAINDNEVGSALAHGVFNLGFLAVNRSEEARKFVDWWTSRLALYCYADMKERGIFTDQKWMDLAPCLFEVHILKHPGYNVASWNLSKRLLTVGEDSKVKVNGQTLYFYHYSGFDSGANEIMIKKYVPDLKHVIYTMRNEYIREMNENGQLKIGTLLWSYGYFLSGEKITKATRVKYRNHEFSWMADLSPFAQSNEAFDSVLPPSSKNRKIFIWGAGTGGRRSKQYYESMNIAIEGFIDRDSNKWGSIVDGVPVFYPEVITKESKEQNKPFIIIGSSFSEEIIANLEQMGFTRPDDCVISYGI